MRQALELALKFVEDSECGTADLEAHIKEALAQPEQEPVAYINIEQRKLEWAYKYMSWDTPTVVNLPKIPLYTTPPQRTWVGLTNDEVNNFAAGCHLGNSVQGAIYKAEAKLKEKNT